MIIKQFRNLNQTNLVPLIAIGILLRLHTFIQRPNELSFDFVEPFAKLLIPTHGENIFSSGANIIIALLLSVIQGLILNKVINTHNIIGKPTSLPALLFVTLSSLFPQFVILSPALLCNFLLIWIISKLLSIYFPFIAMLPILWISLITFRPFVWREWVMGIIGFFVIFFFLGVFYFWNNSLGRFYQIWLPLATTFHTNFHINIYDYLVLIPIIMILLIGIFQLQQNFFRSAIQIRKAFQVFFFLFLLALLSFYLKLNFHIYHFLLCVPTASILAAYFFLNEKRRWLYESLYLILIGFIIYLQLF